LEVAARVESVKNQGVTPDELIAGLRSEDPDRRSRAFETTILDATEVEPNEVEALAAAYRHLSESLLNRAPDAASGRFSPSSSGAFERRHQDAVWGLIFGFRTFEVARRLMEELEPPPGVAVEVGGGWGPYALQASLRGFEVRVVDVASEAQKMSRAVFGCLGLEPPRFESRPAALGDADDATLVAMPYSLWEMRRVDEAEQTAEWLRAWQSRLAPGGQVHIVEAGNRGAARGLQVVRDLLQPSGSILGPCRGAASCPRLAGDDWCHFTWRARPGALTRRVADLAGRRWQERHASWLALGDGAGKGERLLEIRIQGKAKLIAEVCGPGGLTRMTALKRSKDVVGLLERLEPGSLIRVHRDRLLEKGDGLRILSSEAIEVLFRSS